MLTVPGETPPGKRVDTVAPAKATSPTPAPGKTVSVPARFSRAEFEQSAVGKTHSELIRALGHPDTTFPTGGGKQHTPASRPRADGLGSASEVWTYCRKTYDPQTDRIDTTATVYFDSGRATRVSFLASQSP
jgi:hypothetical protein